MSKKKQAHHENLERWLVSYADFITLLFAFFVVLFAMSSVDSKRFKETVQSMNSAFGFIMSEGGGKVFDIPDARYVIPPPIKEIRETTPPIQTFQQLKDEVTKQLAESLNKEELQKNVTVKLTDRGLEISIVSQLFFDSGDAALKGENYPILDKLANVMLKIGNTVMIEGHTDNIPIKTDRYPSNWELSTNRATNIVRYFIDRHNLHPSRLRASGYSEYKPITTNDSAEGRAQNRRIEIVVESGTNKVLLN